MFIIQKPPSRQPTLKSNLNSKNVTTFLTWMSTSSTVCLFPLKESGNNRCLGGSGKRGPKDGIWRWKALAKGLQRTCGLWWGGTAVMLLLRTVYSALPLQRGHWPPPWAGGTGLTAKSRMVRRWTSGSRRKTAEEDRFAVGCWTTTSEAETQDLILFTAVHQEG